MKIAINTVYGGYELPKKFFETHPDKDYFEYGHGSTIRARTDPDVITLIESYGPDGYVGPWTHIIVVDIPDDVTDWKLCENDGAEWLLYIQNGKIHEIYEVDTHEIYETKRGNL